MEATILSTVYHRNGVGGEPFYVVEFTTEYDPECPLTAIIPARFNPHEYDEPDKAPKMEMAECYVIERSNALTKWRGDRLLESLLDAALWDVVHDDMLARLKASAGVLMDLNP